MGKRIISLFLAAVMLLTSIPLSAIATGTEATDVQTQTIVLNPEEVPEKDFTADDSIQDPVYAAGATSGTTGNCTWRLEGTELFIDGDGAMANYSDSATLPWGTTITKVTFGAGVTHIGQYAFRLCTDLTNVEVPKTVESLGLGAFSGCSGLTEITIPFVGGSRKSEDDEGQYPFGYIFGALSYTGGTKISQYDYEKGPGSSVGKTYYIPSKLTSVTVTDSDILSYAFQNCTNLTSVTLENATSIGKVAFDNCTNLAAIDLGGSLKTVGSSAFRNCKCLTSFVFPEGVTKVNTSVFENCYKLSSVTIPDSVTDINSNAFEGCAKLAYNQYGNGLYLGNSSNPYLCLIGVKSTSITEFTTHEDTKVIGRYSLAGCSSLTSLTVTDKVSHINEYAFYGCNKLTNVSIGSSVEQIGSYAFYGCSALPEIKIPDSVLCIGQFAFRDCSSLAMISMGNSVERIENCAFYNCYNLTKITIPDSITYIGYNAFYGCNLTYSRYNNAYYLGNENHPILVLAKISNQNITAFTFEEQTKIILDYAFQGCTKLTEIVIPEHIVLIGTGAFAGCSSLQSMTVPFVGVVKEDPALSFSAFTFANWFGSESASGFYSVTLARDGSTYGTHYLPNSLSYVTVNGGEIRFGAFYGCKGLLSIQLPNGITSIGEESFYGCSALSTISIPETVTSIGEGAFFSSGITSFTIPTGVKRIAPNTFNNCSKLSSITIPDSVIAIEDSAFYSCTSLKKITIPDKVTVIEANAFSYCEGLTSIVVPNSVVSIAEGAFHGMKSLQSITLPFVGGSRKTASDTWQYPFGYIFGSYSYTNGVSTEQSYYGSSLSGVATSFYYIPINLKKVTITGGEILRGAFENCTNLTTVILNEGVTTIDAGAFTGCTKLANITIPNSVVSIGGGAFSGCDSLTYHTEGNGYYLGNSENPCLVLKDTTVTNMTSFTIPKDTRFILNGAFYMCSSLTSIVIPEGVKEINYNTFYGCSKLTSVTIPDSVTSIGSYAFYSCSKLTTVRIPKNVVSVGSNAFAGCSGLTKVESTDLAAWCGISFGNNMANPLWKTKKLYVNGSLLTNLVVPETANRIGDYAFYNCSGITSVTFHDGITEIGKEAFLGCSNVTSLTVPDSVTAIGMGAFSGCSSLQSITVPFVGGSKKTTDDAYQYPFGYIFGNASYTGGTSTSQTYYGSSSSTTASTTYYIPTTLKSVTVTGGNILRGAFYNCKNLTSITIPDSTTELGSHAFYGCSGLKSFTVPKGVTALGSYTFYSCSGLSTLPVHDSIVSLGSYVFYGCTGLKSVTVPDSVTTLGEYAFQKCSGLTEVTVPNSVESIGQGAFNGCSGLQSITIPFIGDGRKAETDKYQYPFGYIFGNASYTGGTSTKQSYYGSSLTNTTTSTYYIPTSLKTVTVTDGNILYGAFSNCTSLTTIVIGEGVLNISKSAFTGTTSLEQFEVAKKNPNYCAVNRILYTKDKSEIIWVPDNHRYIFRVNYIYANGDTAFASIQEMKKTGTEYSAAIPELLGYSTKIDSISGTMPDSDLTIDVVYYENERLIYGDCNNSISWTLYRDGTLVFRGTGDMPDYEIGSAPWAEYADKVLMVYLDARITSIGAYAFEGCRNMTFIDYGYSVESIGAYAFSGCASLVSFKLPESVTVISQGAFSGCTGLKSVVIPDCITAIGENAFSGCSELIQVTIGGSVSEIGSNAFANCGKLTQVYFRGKPVTLGSNALGAASGKFIYYYSSVAGWNAEITDGLWHGYTAIPYNAIAKENFNGTNVYIIKIVDKHNTPLTNAVVNLGGTIQSTNEDGMVYFIKPETVQKLTVSCSNHITFEDAAFMATSTQVMDIIELSDKPSTVQGVRLNNQSIATSVAVVNCAEDKTVTITVSGYSKYTIIKYELYQGNRLITTSKTDATSCTFRVATSAFEEGSTVLVRMHTSDGNFVASALNIDVVKLATIDTKQVIGELSDVNIDIDLGDFGDLGFKLPFSIHGAENIEVYTEGRSIFVGINLDVNELFSRKLSKKEIQKKIDYFMEWDGLDGNASRGVEVKFCGYLEIEYLGNGEYYVKSSYVKMGVALMLESELHASFYGIVGVYFKVKFGAQGELELYISKFSPESGFDVDEINLNLQSMLELEGGAFLLWGMGSVGIFSNLTMGLTIGFVPTTEIKTVYITGNMGVRWKIGWGLLSGEKALGPKDIYRWPEEAIVLAQQLLAAKQDPNSYTENDRSYLEDRGPWLSGGQEDGTLQENIYDGVAPKVVICGDTAVMLWLDDNSQRDNANFQMLYYSVYRNGTWSEPAAVCDNGTFDCEFDVYSDGEKVYVIYTEMKDTLSSVQSLDITDASSIEAFVTGVEVNVIVYENGAFGTPIRLTDNNICEQLPTLQAVNGVITATWLESNSLGIGTEIAGNSVIQAVFENNGWSDPAALASDQNSISDIISVSLNGNTYTAYIVDADGDTGTTSDQVLVLRNENGDFVQLDTGSIANVAFADIAGDSALTWYNNGSIYMITDPEQTPVSLTPEDTSAGIDYQIVSLSDTQTLLFYTASTSSQTQNAEEGTDLFGMYIGCNGAISSPVQMTKTQGYVTSYCVYAQDGELFAVFTETFAEVSEEGLETVTHFRTAELVLSWDIVIRDVQYDVTTAHPSSDFNLHFSVTNSGTNAVDCLTLNFYDHQGNLLYTADCDVALGSGTSAEFDATVVLPQSISADAYVVEILPQSKMTVVADVEPENNRAELALAYSDMTICAEQKIIGEKNYIIFTVTNEGNTASTSLLQAFAQNKLISEMETGLIAPGSTEQYIIDIHALTTSEDKVLTCSVSSAFTDPFTLNDTASVYLLHIENDSLAVDPEDAIRNPEISVNVAEFDKFSPKDITLEITAEADFFAFIEGLTPDTDYSVAYDTVTIRSAYLASLSVGTHTLNFVFDFGDNTIAKRSLTVVVSDSSPVALTGSVSISGDAVVGGTVYADTSKLTPGAASLQYTWSLDGVSVSTSSSYTITAQDKGKTLTLTVTAAEGFTGTFTAEAAVTLAQPAAPAAPVISKVESSAITLIQVEGMEYSLDGTNWQTGNVFTDLLPNQTYTVFARVKATDMSLASQISAGTTVTTRKRTVSAPAAPQVESVKNDTVILVSSQGMEYRIEGGQWTDNNEFTGLQPGVTYVFYQRYQETDIAYASEASSASFTTLDVVYGDADGDGFIDAYDASLVMKYSVGAISADTLDLRALDVDGDGYVDAYDASLIQKFSVGVIDKFPAEE